jgi:hypothetical protein
MNTDQVLLALGAVATAALWIVALVSGRVRRSDVVAGLRNGAIVGASLGLAVAAFALLIFNGQSDALGLALNAGLTIGLGYFWLGAALMPIGFLARGGYDWARYGTWVAIVIIIFAAGLGYTAYRAFQETPATQSSPSPAPPSPAPPPAATPAAPSGLVRREPVA